MDQAAFTLDRPKSGKLERGLATPLDSTNKTATPLTEKGSPLQNLEVTLEKGTRPNSRYVNQTHSTPAKAKIISDKYVTAWV